jgi:putative transposase
MTEINEKIKSLNKYFSNSPTFNTFNIIVMTMLYMSGSKNMLNISRWAKLSYKKVERFFDKSICWLSINLAFLNFLVNKSEFILASDETLATKSGNKTHGLDKFFSSTLKKVVKAICMNYISLIDVNSGKSHPVYCRQLVFTPEEKELLKQKKEKIKKSKGGKRGRPKGSKNNSDKDKPLAPTFRLLKEMLTKFFELSKLSIKYFVGDGYYGNNTCAIICSCFGIYLISKLQSNTALYFKAEKKKYGRGRPPKYGEKLNLINLPEKYLKEVKIQDFVETQYYQLFCLNKSFEHELNVVIMIHTDLKTKKVSHSILFSTDLELSYQKIIFYYRSRFQIEFNFRDAKEFWGLEDFMNIKEERIHNFVNLSGFMVNLSQALIRDHRKFNKLFSTRDLISVYRCKFYTSEILKSIKKKHPNFLFDENSINPYPYGIINL